MKMQNENDEKRVGISTQVSVEATATGEGFASKGEKSPVANEPEKVKEIEEVLDLDSDDDELPPLGPERDKLNRLTKIQDFPSCQRKYGSRRWGKVIQTLRRIGFVNWEINSMLGALDKLAKEKLPVRRVTLNEPVAKQPRLSPPNRDEERLHFDKTFPIRINIGDASHPTKSILRERQSVLKVELHHVVNIGTQQTAKKGQTLGRIGVKKLFYANNQLVAECNNLQTVDFIVENLPTLNSLWEDTDLVICDRNGIRARVQMFVKCSGIETQELLKTISNQNTIDTANWKVITQENVEGGTMLDVEVDAQTYVRLFDDQDELYCLLDRVTVTMPQ